MIVKGGQISELYLRSKKLPSEIKNDLWLRQNSPHAAVFTAMDMYAVADVHYKEDNYLFKPTLLTSLNTVAISTHRDKYPVRALGNVNPLGITSGRRTIAGTFVFTQIGQAGIRDIFKQDFSKWRWISGLDDLPSLDISITFVNEAGEAAMTILYGVNFLDEGETISLDDNNWMISASYMAMSRQPLVLLSEMVAPPQEEEKTTIIQGTTSFEDRVRMQRMGGILA